MTLALEPTASRSKARTKRRFCSARSTNAGGGMPPDPQARRLRCSFGRRAEQRGGLGGFPGTRIGRQVKGSSAARSARRGGSVLKPQVLHCQALIDELAKRVNPHAQVHFREVRRHLLVALGGLDAFRRHRLIGYQQQSAAGNLVVEPGDEYGRGFHVNGHASDLTQIPCLLYTSDAADE